MRGSGGKSSRIGAGRSLAVRTALLCGTALWGAISFASEARAGGPLPAPLHDGGLAPAAGGSLTLVNSAQVAGGAGAKPTYSVNAAGTTGTIVIQAQRTLIDWSTYQVNAGYTLNYVVSNASDIVLNRVPAGVAIQIYGSVTSTLSGGMTTAGNLWFLAPGGVFFHDGSSVSAGGILATTGSLPDSGFLNTANNSFSFTGANGLVQVGDGGADPVTLRTSGGNLALISRTVSTTGNASIGSMGSGSSDTASVLYGGAVDFTVAFVDQGYNGLDLFSFQINTGTDAANALALQGATQSGRIYVAAVNAGTAVQGLIQLGGSIAATNASLSGDNLVLSAGSGLANTGSTSAPGALVAAPATGTAASIGLAGSLSGGGVQVNATGRIGFDGGGVASSGVQTYDGAVVLGADTTLTGSTVTFNGTVDGAYALSILGGALFGPAVGSVTPLTSLSVSGSSGFYGGPVTTTGTQTYTGGVILGVNTDLIGPEVVFKSTVDGPYSLSITGDASFSGTVGGLSPLTSLSVSGASALDGAITTTGAQTYTGAVTLGGDTTLTAPTMTFDGTVDGAHALSITGAPTFDAAVGGLSPLTSLSIIGPSALDGATIATTGTQAYTGAVTLGVNTTLTGSTTTFNGAVDGAYALSILGDATFGPAVGSLTPLTSLSVSGSSGFYGGPVTTTGAQTYTGGVILGVDTHLVGSEVAFGSTVDGAHSLSIIGDASFGGAVGGLAPLTSLSVSGSSALDGGAITTSGTQTYTGAVTLGADTSLNASTLTFDGTIDGAHALSITGATTFDAAVGGLSPLTSLSIIGPSALDGGTIATSGTQTYTGAVTLGVNTTLTGSTTTFDGTVDGAYALSIVGDVTFGPTVGGLAPLASLSVSGSSGFYGGPVTTTGAQTYTGGVILGVDTSLVGSTVAFGSTVDGAHNLAITGDASFGGAVGGLAPLTSLSVSGASALDGGAISTTGAQTYTGAVTLGTDVVLTGSTMTFSGAVDGAHAISITGDPTFDAAVGASTPLASLSIVGPSTLDGGTITTSGTQTYTGAVVLGADTTLTGSTMTFNGTVDGAYALSIMGGALFGPAVGSVTPLTSLSVSGSSGFYGGPVTTTGTQTYTGGATLGVDTRLIGSSVLFRSTVDGPHSLTITGDAIFDGVVGASAPLASLSVVGPSALDGGTITTSGAQAYTGAVTLGADTSLTASTMTFNGTVNGAYALLITGAPTFDAAVGASTPLTSLSIIGPSALDGGTITTSGTQTYTGAVTLGAVTALTGSTTTFNGTVDGAYGLSILSDVNFGPAVGGVAPLTSLSVSGSSGFYGGPITTTGTQTYTGGVSLGADTRLVGSSILFRSTVDGPHSLTITGDASFDAAVGGFSPLTSLLVSGAGVLEGGAITTTGAQTYTGAVTLGADASLTASTLTFERAVDGPYALSITGAPTFDAAVGASTPLASLSIVGPSTLDGGAITTSGTQTYIGAVVLGADTTLTGSTMTFNGTVDGAYALSILGGALFGPAVGSVTPLTSLSVSGSSGFYGGPVTTTGTQTYTGGVTLGADTGLIGSSILFKSTVDGAHSLSVTGDATFSGAVGEFAPLASLSVSGLSTFDGGAIYTTGAQTYAGGVTLDVNTGVVGSSIVFDSTVDGAHSLSITGATTFDAAVGGMAPLANLFVVGPSVTLGAPITTTGDLSLSTTASTLTIPYALTAGGDLTLSAGGSAANLELAVSVTAGAVTELDATGNVTQTGGIITTPTLGGTIGGSAALNAANQVQTLEGLSAAGGLSFTNAAGFTVADLDAGPSAVLTASTGDLTLAGNVTAATLVLDVPQGSIRQTGGALTASLLQGTAGGSISLTDANALTALSDLTAPGSIAVVNGASLKAGGVTAGSSLSLATVSGDLTLTGGLTANTVSLAAGGGVQQAGGIVTAASLAVTAGQSVSLGDANVIGVLQASSSGGGFLFDNASGFSVTQVAAGTGNLSLTALGGDIQATGPLQAGLSVMVYAAKGSVSVGSATAGGDVRVVAGGGSVSVGAVQAGDNVFVVGATGAGLQSATLTPGTTVDSDNSAFDGLSLSPANPGVRRVLVESLTSGTAVFGAATQAATSSIDQFSLEPGVSAAGVSTEISGAAGVAVNLETAAPITLVQASTGAASVYVATGPAQVGTLSASGGLSLVAGGDATLGQALTPGALNLDVGGNLQLGGGSVGAATTILTTSFEVTGVLTTPTLTIQARGGTAAIGGTDSAAPTSLRVSQASFDNIQAGVVNVYAGAADGSGPDGALTVDTLALNQSGGQVSALNLYTHGQAVLVEGALTPGSARPVALTIGSGAWTPDDILIMNDGSTYTGSLGAAKAGAGGATYSGVQSFASLDLNATNDIIAGTPAFIRALQAAPAADAVAVLKLEPPVTSNGTPAVFIVGASITLRSGGRIVSQDTSGYGVADTGLLVTGSTPSLLLGANAGGGAPAAIDLFGAIASGSGYLTQSSTAVANQQLVLISPLTRSNLYQFNGCVIDEVGTCTPLNTDIVVIQPDRLTLAALLKPYEDQDAEDPTIIAGANEEVWLSLDSRPPCPAENPRCR